MINTQKGKKNLPSTILGNNLCLPGSVQIAPNALVTRKINNSELDSVDPSSVVCSFQISHNRFNIDAPNFADGVAGQQQRMQNENSSEIFPP